MILKIIVANKILLECKTLSVVTPGDEGELAVLPKHCNMIVSLKSGLVKIKDDHNKTYKYFIYNGLMLIDRVCIIIFTDFSVNIDNYDKIELVKQIEYLKEQVFIKNDKSNKEKIIKYEVLLNHINLT